MSARRSVLAFAAVAGLGVAGLLTSGAEPRHWTAFSERVPAKEFVITLLPSQKACQGPINPTSGFGAIEAWIWPLPTPGPDLGLTLRRAGTRVPVATGLIAGGYSEPYPPTGSPTPIALSAPLSANQPADRPFSLCVRDDGSVPVTLMGWDADHLSGVLESSAVHTPQSALALLFLRAHPQSFLSMLPTAFDRATLFHPVWVGAWTFWLLIAALLAAFALGGVALSRASAADYGDGETVSGHRALGS